MKKNILAYFLVLHSLVYAQVVPVSPTIPTPNAANLGVYGEMPVSYFTGTPQIDIPIHTIKTDYLTFPISLSYYAGGFRPDIHPSWVGMNWSLNAGGVITRTVRSLPDEYNDYGISPPNGYGIWGKGFYFTSNLLNNTSWHTVAANQVPNCIQKDREPDIFSFNFLDYSGKFFLDHLGNWKVQSNKPLKVTFNSSDFALPFVNRTVGSSVQRTTFTKFTITDDKGVQFIFGTDNAIEYSVGMYPDNNDFLANALATSWYLVKIVPPSGFDINLNYERGPYQSSFNYYQTQSGCTWTDGTTGFLSSYGQLGSYNNGLSGTITSPVYLTNINYVKDNVNIDFVTSKSNELKYNFNSPAPYTNPAYANPYIDLLRDQNGSISAVVLPSQNILNMTSGIPYFSRNPSEANATTSDLNTSKYIWLKLDRIDIKYNSSILTHIPANFASHTRKQVTFNYTENSGERLKLNTVITSLENNVDPQTYSFTYDPSVLAPYLTEISDHWGFSNDQPLQRTGSGTYAGISDAYNYRQPVAGKALRGLLKEIKYPTGGKSVFYYENHECNAVANYNSSGYYSIPGTAMVGGARIKKIENYDGLGNKTFKEYVYSNGLLESKPKYVFNFTGPVGGGYTNTQVLYNSSSIVPVSSTSSGRHIGYSGVRENFQDGSYKLYTFSNHNNGYVDQVPLNLYNVSAMSYMPVSSMELERGKVLSEYTYTTASVLRAKKEISYQRYGYTADNFIRTVSMDRTFCYPATILSADFPSLAAYYNFAHYFLPSNVKEYYYDEGNREIMTETINSYDAKGLVTNQQIIGSDGNSSHVSYTYPYNHAGDAIMDAMVVKNMISLPITTNKYKNSTFLESIKNNYSSFHNGSFIALSNVQYKRGNGQYQTKYRYNSYDSYGNITEMQKENDIKEVYLWGFYGRWPVAKITGSDYTSVSSVVNMPIINRPEGNAQLQQELGNLRMSLPAAFVTGYGYSLYGDLISETNVMGRTISYEYDNKGRLDRIRDPQNNILKQFEYKYQEVFSFPYRNIQKVSTYNKNDCPSGYAAYVPNPYTVPADKYGSFLSQADADLKATNEIELYGAQAYANANGVCYPTYTFTPCCGWGSAYSSFALSGTNTVNFSIVIYRQSGTTIVANQNYQAGTLSGSAFLPASTRTITTTHAGRTWSFTITAWGTITVKLLSGSTNIGSGVQIAGSYNK